MTDKVYTQQELKEMADQLLAADDKKKAGKAAAQKAEEAKPVADKALDEPLLGVSPVKSYIRRYKWHRIKSVKGIVWFVLLLDC